MITGPREAGVQEVPAPVAAPGEVVVDVQRAGVCGTDVEFYTGEMQYLHEGYAAFPMRIGHEWMGTVSAIGDGVDRSWLGRRVTGDTMLGCGVCRRCRRRPPARLRVPLRGRHPRRQARRARRAARRARPLPAPPAGRGRRRARGPRRAGRQRAARRRAAPRLRPGDTALVLGPGTIGLLVAMFARAAGAEVHLMGRTERSLEFARDARLRRRLDRGASCPTCRGTRSSTPPTRRRCRPRRSTSSSRASASSTSVSPAARASSTPGRSP